MRYTIIFLTLFALFFQPNILLADLTNAVPTAVVVGFDRGQVKYEVDSKPVRSDAMLDVFREIKKQKGRNAPIVVLVDERNSLATLSNICGLVNKSGFSGVRYFYFTANREKMGEIGFGQKPAIPFSLNPESSN